MKFYIFRHAETYPSREFIPYDENSPKDNFETDILYSGKESIRRMADYLKGKEIDFWVSSPYERCKETMEIISEVVGEGFVFDARVGEYINIEYVEFRQRVEMFLKEVEEKNFRGVAICTHGAVISQLMHLLCDKKPEENITVFESVYSGILLEVENREFKEINFND